MGLGMISRALSLTLFSVGSERPFLNHLRGLPPYFLVMLTILAGTP